MQEAKDIKVKIPVKYHVQLHTLKILHGKNMSEALTEALDQYFSDPRNASLATEASDALDH